MNSTRSTAGSVWSIGLAGGFAVLLVGAFIVLVILPLLSPPPAVEEPYRFAVSDETVISMVAGNDYLVEISDGNVAVYIPGTAHGGEATFTLRSRHPAFVPNKSDAEFDRLLAVDLILSEDSGEPIESASFREPILLCFRLTEAQQTGLRQDPEMFGIQHYAETSGAGQWANLDPAPGWENGQLCTLVDHLSLFALVENLKVSGRSVPKDLRTPIVTVVPPAMYGVPSEDPGE